MNDQFKKIKEQIFNLSSKVWLYLAVGTLLVGAGLFFLFFRPNNQLIASIGFGSEQTEQYRHPLTGEWQEEEIDQPSVFGVIVENMSESWPLVGLEDAFLAIEAPVEAGIPRILAFYDSNEEVEKIGPVRSVRPYFIDWNDEFKALFAHVGGSNAALDIISSRGTFDLNQFTNGQYFWRGQDRYAPHNVYTSTDLLQSAYELRVEQSRAPESIYGLWWFKDDAPSGIEEVPEVTLDFSRFEEYQITWKYDLESNQYHRSQDGGEHTMENGEKIIANNVAIIVTDIRILDSVGRRSIKTIGEGEAVILQDGRTINGSWKKTAVGERLRFYNEAYEEILWNAGKTWIEVLPNKEDIEIK